MLSNNSTSKISLDSANTNFATFPQQSSVDFIYYFFRSLRTRFQKIIDDSTPHSQIRWGFTGGVLFLYILKILIWGGWYIISYALAIYVLNSLLGFLTPLVDPALDEDSLDDENADGPSPLPTNSSDEFKPFIRKVHEFKFWYKVTQALLLAFTCTFF